MRSEKKEMQSEKTEREKQGINEAREYHRKKIREARSFGGINVGNIRDIRSPRRGRSSRRERLAQAKRAFAVILRIDE
jgi:hypothetical protein